MSDWKKVLGFAVAVIAAVAVAVGIGRWVGPIGADDSGHAHADDRIRLTPVGAGGSHEDAHGAGHDGGAAATLALEEDVVAAGRLELAFTVVGADGEPVTSYDVQHEKLLHLVLVRRDLGGYRHVHPELDEDTGRWATPLDLEAGSWRVYADFTPAGGDPTVAGADLSVAGDFAPKDLPADSDTDRVGDYEVHLSRAGEAATFHVTRSGEEVDDLQPYLGAYGHLVAIRASDLAYLHVHPEESGQAERAETGEVAFAADLAEADRYRLFFEFRHDGRVRRAEFTVTVGESPARPSEAAPDDGHGHDQESAGTEGESRGHDH